MPLQPSGNSGTIVEVEANTRAMRVTPRPDDYGALGIYQIARTPNLGVMAAGLAANSPIFAFRNSTTNIYTLRRAWLSVSVNSTAFAAGVGIFNLFIARSWSVNDTGGTSITPTGNQSKLRTSMATTGVADIRASATLTLTAGTRTKDAQPISSCVCGVVATIGISLVGPQYPLWDARFGDWPIALAQNEGIVLEATVPATGTWDWSLTLGWAELASY